MPATASPSRERRVQRVGSLVRWSKPLHTRPATHSSVWENTVTDNIVQVSAADLGEEGEDAEPDLSRQPGDQLVRTGQPGIITVITSAIMIPLPLLLLTTLILLLIP